ncbi:MAG: cytochrome c biogenesis protein CcsA [Candidatus Sulfobium sp.]|jgi:ABC-type transport system involved in cytochrome c biogenesis permease subunit
MSLGNPVLLLTLAAAAFYTLGCRRKFFILPAFLIQAGYMFYRGMLLGRMPIVGPHDTLFFLSASIALFGFPLTFKQENSRPLFYSVTALSLLFLFLSLPFKPHSSPLPPVLKTVWFEAHVALSFFSYALFGIGAVLGAVFLSAGEKRSELLQYKTIVVGYFLFSAAMVFGGIWAYLAWGTYWLWTPKELWTVILWLFYGLYLHARLTSRWTGRPAALLGIVGFIIVMFTYLGVSLLMKSSHSF